MQYFLLACLLGIVIAQDAPVAFDPAYPEENPGLFEGDIDLRPGDNPKHRNAMRDHHKLWPQGTVPYEIDATHAKSASHVTLFHSAMQEIMDKTMVNGKKCINFVPHTNQKTYIRFTSGSGCHTPVGYYPSYRCDVTLGAGCLRKGTVMHEILHSLGFWHEQSRTDRDNYVTIHWSNIQKGHERNFDKYGQDKIDHLNMPYDYGSVMHYSAYAFAVNRGQMTIEPKQTGVTIGQRVRLSDIDAKEIQILYGCVPRPSSPGQTNAPTQAPGITRPPSITHVTVGTHSPNAAATCTFDHGLCEWHQSTEDNLDWIARHGKTPSANTGPHADHLGSTSANYLYMEASGHYHQSAILESRTYTPGYYCFSVWFDMNGNTMGTLRFNLVENGHKYTFKSYSGDHHDTWYHLRVGLNVHTYNFKIQIEGYTGSSYRSDMAIDDISVTPGHCTH